MPLTDVPGKARALAKARRTRTPIPAFTDDDPDLGMADGYAVQAAVADAVAAVEIVDSRFANWRIKLADTGADLASNGAVATSGPLVPFSDFDPRLVGMVLTRNGQLVNPRAEAART